MQYKTLAFFAALASNSLAVPTAAPTAPEGSPPGFSDKFGVEATGSGIHNVDLTASEGSIFIGGHQDPTCVGGQPQDFATFILYSDHTVFLYKPDNPPQQLYVDASGMGGGISGYTSNNEQPPKNASRDRFAIDPNTGSLTFNNVGAKACPTGEEGKYSVWFTNSEKPGNQDGCVCVNLKAYSAPARTACTYTS